MKKSVKFLFPIIILMAIVVSCDKEPSQPTVAITEPYSVPDMVDLGLPSGIKWASFNLGASKPEEHGGYYQWGGTTDVTSTSIYLDWSNCPYHTGTDEVTEWTKYISSGKSSYWSGSDSPDNKSVLDPEDDVANIKLGGKWRMPTKEEWDELISACNWTLTTVNGIEGYKVSSKKSGYTSNYIFLPVVGYRYDNRFDCFMEYVAYWSSSLITENPIDAYVLHFSPDIVSTNYKERRYIGRSVRPVYGDIVKATSISLNKTSVSMASESVIQLTATLNPSNCDEKGLLWSSSNTEVATVSTSGQVMAKSEGSAVITVSWSGDSNIKATCDVTVTEPCPVPNMVDLGLPSGIKWASCNLGASKPEEYGGYYQWAGLDGVSYTSIYLDWSNCPYHTGSDFGTGWTKYVPSNMPSYWSGAGSPDNKTALDSEDDVAHVKLGGSWRMPTEAEFHEMTYNCISEWTTQNGVNGMKFTSKKNGNSIFLPAAGRCFEGLCEAGSFGYYFSSSLDTDRPYRAFEMLFNSGSMFATYSERFCGQSVRPVSD